MTNINPLLTNTYRFSIGRGDEKLTLFGQGVGIPGVKLNTQPQPTTLGIQIPVAVNTFNFEPLNLEFIVDENLENWKSIYDWMKSIGNISNDVDNTRYHTWDTSANLDILGSNYLPLNGKTIRFYYAIPVSLSGINFKSDASDSAPIKARVSFEYSYYEFV
jgi:hypothetical protein